MRLISCFMKFEYNPRTREWKRAPNFYRDLTKEFVEKRHKEYPHIRYIRAVYEYETGWQCSYDPSNQDTWRELPASEYDDLDKEEKEEEFIPGGCNCHCAECCYCN